MDNIEASTTPAPELLELLDDDWVIPSRTPTPPDLFTKNMEKDQPLKHVHRM
jgi:hypothetical protein